MKLTFFRPGKPLYRLIVGGAHLFLRGLNGSLRVTIRDEAGILDGSFSGAAVGVVWHNRILSTPALMPPSLRQRTWAMASRSDDGQVITDVLQKLGFHSLRGSAMKNGRDKGGATALMQAIHVLQEGKLVCIIPDGPRGPRYSVQPGAVMAAVKAGVPIIPLGVNHSCAIRLPSWDKLEIPLPFSRAELVIGKPFRLDEDSLAPEKLPLAKEKIRLALLAITPG
ncbi:MAG: hypothetical protein RL095_4197 [Verrucomicrobiota bacterium]|jgi:lysophospholipid acyltransferase (LPLAT)-like uncharacterized protein